VVSSNSQVGPNTISGHHVSTGKHANIIAGSVGSRDVADNNLTGADIANRSGVDTCPPPLVAKFGPICAGSDGALRTWQNSVAYCAGLGLRLPTFSEAVALADNYDVPGVPGANNDPYFWTGEEAEIAGTLSAREVDDSGSSFFYRESGTNVAVCVTDPSA
jgi:hypothetical protein